MTALDGLAGFEQKLCFMFFYRLPRGIRGRSRPAEFDALQQAPAAHGYIVIVLLLCRAMVVERSPGAKIVPSKVTWDAVEVRIALTFRGAWF